MAWNRGEWRHPAGNSPARALPWGQGAPRSRQWNRRVKRIRRGFYLDYLNECFKNEHVFRKCGQCSMQGNGLGYEAGIIEKGEAAP